MWPAPVHNQWTDRTGIAGVATCYNVLEGPYMANKIIISCDFPPPRICRSKIHYWDIKPSCLVLKDFPGLRFFFPPAVQHTEQSPSRRTVCLFTLAVTALAKLEERERFGLWSSSVEMSVNEECLSAPLSAPTQRSLWKVNEQGLNKRLTWCVVSDVQRYKIYSMEENEGLSGIKYKWSHDESNVLFLNEVISNIINHKYFWPKQNIILDDKFVDCEWKQLLLHKMHHGGLSSTDCQPKPIWRYSVRGCTVSWITRF